MAHFTLWNLNFASLIENLADFNQLNASFCLPGPIDFRMGLYSTMEFILQDSKPQNTGYSLQVKSR